MEIYFGAGKAGGSGWEELVDRPLSLIVLGYVYNRCQDKIREWL